MSSFDDARPTSGHGAIGPWDFGAVLASEQMPGLGLDSALHHGLHAIAHLYDNPEEGYLCSHTTTRYLLGWLAATVSGTGLVHVHITSSTVLDTFACDHGLPELPTWFIPTLDNVGIDLTVRIGSFDTSRPSGDRLTTALGPLASPHSLWPPFLALLALAGGSIHVTGDAGHGTWLAPSGVQVFDNHVIAVVGPWSDHPPEPPPEATSE